MSVQNDDTLFTNINRQIRESMPGLVGDQLQKLLEQGRKDAAELVVVRHALEHHTQSNTLLGQEVQGLKAELAKHNALIVRAAAVETAERNMTVLKLTLELAAEKRITEHALDLTSRLVRNTDFKSMVYTSRTEPVIAAPSGGGTPYATGMTSNTTGSETTVRTAE